MDFALRCNNLKCRAQLTERAVVTTCSHIFCTACSQNLGLDAAPSGQRICPACETSLPNPDDVVSTQLNPTEDYKTSVLSGFTPSTIVDVYQEYLAKSLTDKYNNMGTQMDKIIHDANTEIAALNQKISNLQIDREKLQSENTNLVAAFREKSRKHQQTQELYDRLKRKEMTAATQSAAFESVDEVLSHVAGRTDQGRPQQHSFIPRPHGQRDLSQYQYDSGQDLGHRREGSNGSGGSGSMMPPPLRRPTALGSHLFGNHGNTPSQHRTQLGARMQTAHQQDGSRNSSSFMTGLSHSQTPSQRQPLGTMSASSVNRSNHGGYGMSAGLKVGRQQGMDPLSITASTIALVGLGLKLLKGLEILKDLSHIPDDISALIDELQDLQDVLAAVCVATKQRASVGGLRECSIELKSLLSKAGDIFASIANHCGITISVQHDVGREDLGSSSGSTPNLDLLARFRWLKDRKKIDQYRRRLKVLRLDIGNHLASLSLVDSCSVLVELRGLASAFRKLSIDHSILQTSIAQARPHSTSVGMVKELDPTYPSSSPPNYSPMSPTTPTVSPVDTMLNRGNVIASLSTCSCRCHRVNKIRTPAAAQGVVGSLTLKLNGFPTLTPACDEIACRRSMHSSFKLTYRFPSWFSNCALNSMVYSSRAGGPQMALTCSRIISRDSDLFYLAMQGDIAGIKNLFMKGLASPFDATNNYGYTALHYATDYGHYELCDFLLKAGAKGDMHDFDDRTATDIAYHKICAPSFDQSSAERLRTLFDEESWLEQKQFTTLHKIVLRLTNTCRSLDDELLVSTKEINVTDSEGRTPISWAAEHNDDRAVAILLKFGADASKSDNDGNTPLHYACSCTGGPSVLPLLLTAGAAPTVRNKWRQTPLNWASFFQNDPIFAQQLLACPGVHLNEVDYHGCTAIGNAAFKCNEEMLRYLLDAGADPNFVENDSTTALLECISSNNHASLAILLEKLGHSALNLAHQDAKSETCLHYLARRADVETIAIFLQALHDGSVDIAGLDTAHVGKDGLTVRDVLALRGFVEVKDAMMQVLEIIDREVASEKSSVLSDEVVYTDAMEFLPQLEKDIGIKAPKVAVREIEVV
ncbi:MAG: hypothetical protein Q9181_004289 [Wetmoreana brouardii]